MTIRERIEWQQFETKPRMFVTLKTMRELELDWYGNRRLPYPIFFGRYSRNRPDLYQKKT